MGPECGADFARPEIYAVDKFVSEQWALIEIIARKNPNELTALIDGKLQYRFKPVNDSTQTHQEQWVSDGFNGTASVLHQLSVASRGYPTVGWWEGHDMYLDYSLARVIISEQSSYNQRWTPKFGQVAKVGSRPQRRSLECPERDGATRLS